MSYCDDCIILDICGKEECCVDAMTFCSDKHRFIHKGVIEDIKAEITEKIAYQEKRISRLDNTHTYPSPKPRPVEFSVIPRNPQEITLVKRDGIIEGYENVLEIIDKHMRGE